MVLGALLSNLGRFGARFGPRVLRRLKAPKTLKYTKFNPGSRSTIASVGSTRSSLGTLGRSNIGSMGSRLNVNKFSSLGSRTSLLNQPSKLAKFGGRLKSNVKSLGSRFAHNTRRGLKATWRKFQLDPVGSAVSTFGATRNPNVRLTIDGLERSYSGDLSNPKAFENYAAFSSW